jgi:hypothetical protein
MGRRVGALVIERAKADGAECAGAPMSDNRRAAASASMEARSTDSRFTGRLALGLDAE